MTKKLVGFVTAVMTTLLALVVLWQFHIVVVYVLISLALAATLRPFIKGWSRRGFVTRLALILLYLIGLGSFGGYDHFAGTVCALAVPHCGCLRSGLACACGNCPSIL